MAGYQRSSAFTFIELLIVIALIGILTSTAIIRYGPVAENARAAEASAVLGQIMSSENIFRVERGAYTNNWNDLDRFDNPGPRSNNFTFTIPDTGLNTGYAQAARLVAAAGRNSYGVCFRSGRIATCANADACDPACP